MKLSPELIDRLMTEALGEARKAAALGEVPVGAILAVGGEIVSRAHNLVETRKDATAHAELLAIREAGEALGNWRLSDAVLCVTLEPCTMCIGALRLARVPAIIFGADDPKMGAVGSLYDLSVDDRVGPMPRIVRGIKGRESRALMSSFFQARRAQAQSKLLH